MYYCQDCDWSDASMDKIEKCPKCGGAVTQDEDVLDTWFSSQLWPFATQGWADGDPDGDLAKYYPTQVLSTARDIMGLWVARMVMASEYCMNQIPFEEVLIHPTVMGADGKPMSKSRGNGVDPLELIADFGADAMRFGLLSQVTGTQAIRFDKQKIETSRNFSNKIKNASRFVTMNLEGFECSEPVPNSENAVDKWILSRLANLVKTVDEAYKTYDFAEVTKALYTFFWNEFCDWYIELSKGRLNSDTQDKVICQNNLLFVLVTALKLLHPIMPFITEQIYQDLPIAKDAKHIMMSAWPDFADFECFIDPSAEQSIGVVCDAVGSVRSIRARYGISPKTDLSVIIKPANDNLVSLINSQAELIKKLANIADFNVDSSAVKPESSSVVVGDLEIFVILDGLVDFEAEKARLQKELDAAKKDEAMFSKKLSNPGFLNNAKPEIIAKDKAKLAAIQENISRLSSQINELN